MTVLASGKPELQKKLNGQRNSLFSITLVKLFFSQVARSETYFWVAVGRRHLKVGLVVVVGHLLQDSLHVVLVDRVLEI